MGKDDGHMVYLNMPAVRIDHAVAVGALAFLCIFCVGAEQSGDRDRLRFEGPIRLSNLEMLSFNHDPRKGELKAKPGNVLSVRPHDCYCPEKGQWWYYEYAGREKQPLAFSQNDWSLRLGGKGRASVVGLNLAHSKARSWVQEAAAKSLAGVTSAYVDKAAIQTGTVGLLGSLRTLSCDPEISQREFERLSASLPDLVALDISECEKITDLAPLAGLKRLKVLDISLCPRIEDLSPLVGLKDLIYLRAEGSPGIWDLRPLSRLGQLKTLDLSGCEGVFEVGPLMKLKGLKGLHLRNCRLSTRDARHFASLAHLRALSLPLDTQDDDLREVCTLHPDLELLGLRGCGSVTSLAPLHGLKKLSILQFDDNTGVSKDEIRRFQKTAPKCRIERFEIEED